MVSVKRHLRFQLGRPESFPEQSVPEKTITAFRDYYIDNECKNYQLCSTSSPMNSVDIDPLALAIAPPPNETPQERAEREYAEAEALRIRYVSPFFS